ncbi:hypothetical protein ACM8AW_02510 [Pseudomonas aeruginosa]|uniref:hypothetical protein n=1 Tax=Pseudomonas aeruginosa TaxID=287 RepID=UPI0021AE5395|nr:hypothetical protein [Pseudomonas aeruginosa]EKX2002795.1 hypothetical protein [Pseudomonas aeruginosa]MCT5378486.1 hypothetical protein [Pseudomonas aeruginosa]MCV0239637.1 hypothetical protein [Pseudomonas aeruginosa]HCF1728774.1 hypothetical protein [Pseudomonas aeruginosa]HCF4383922.1 hypothetical protein [Pseudomonas aeruginosa]
MNFENSVSPGVSAFVAKMRVRAAQSPGAILPGHGHPASLAWRVSPAGGRLETQVEENPESGRRPMRG